MIVGIGTDLVAVERIRVSLEKTGDRLAEKVLSGNEMSLFRQHHNPEAYLAKRFAAKEAVAKALGTGIGVVSWHDIEIINDENGAPKVVPGPSVRRRMDEIGARVIHISISDELESAIAFAVAES